jgi:hypothetical protein
MTDPELVAILRRLAAGETPRSSQSGVFAAAAAAIDGLTKERDEALAEAASARRELDAVADLLIGEWAGDRWCAQVRHRPEGYPGGAWDTRHGASWYWFKTRHEAVAAVRLAAGLGGQA